MHKEVNNFNSEAKAQKQLNSLLWIFLKVRRCNGSLRVLFWNTHKNIAINPIIYDLIVENNISIIVLAEYVANSEELLKALLFEHGINMEGYYSSCERIKIFGIHETVEARFDSDHATIQVFNKKDILCCVHLNSKIYSDNEEHREILIEQIMHEIQNVEKDLQTQNTIIVGDFNLNPYDSSCINARYFHGLPVYEEAKRKTRVVAGNKYSMFYNPMWRFLGDETHPYGTYYHNNNSTINTYWNLYDQVIIRPALRERFVDESLKIITETQSMYLLDNKGHPNKDISDHLPISFEIREENCNG